MKKLKLPEADLKLKSINNKEHVFDRVRKKYVVLTPEEWVRQNFLCFLIDHLGFPGTLIRVETAHTVKTLIKRTDIVVYNRKVEPVVLVECKAPEVKLSDKVAEQIIIYNKEIKAPFIVITNGMSNFCFTLNNKEGTYQFSSFIPSFSQLEALDLI